MGYLDNLKGGERDLNNMSLNALGSSVQVIAEIGINHNGDMALAKRMISLSAVAGCN